MSWFYALFGQIIFFLKPLIHLLYPDLCIHCKRELTAKSPYLCYTCLMDLELIKWQRKQTYNQVFQAIQSTSVVQICALYRFRDSAPIQTLLHELKYRHNSRLGAYFGTVLGLQFQEENATVFAQALIPVPIHPRKRFDRGYNQSELIANGVSRIICVPVKTNLIKKAFNTKTQTKLSKKGRAQNIRGSFRISDDIVNYQAVAIVDDVITTGATINAICEALLEKNANLQITIFSLALAQSV
jgi:ComF family protein